MTQHRPLGRLAVDWSSAEPTPLTEALAAAGPRVVDLVTANPQLHGFAFPPATLAEVTGAAVARSLVYTPDPRGAVAARCAIADYHNRRGQPTDPGQLLLFPGTSLAYLTFFRLLAGAGAEILVPTPGYPLFDDLATAAGIRLRQYYLSRTEGGNWVPSAPDIDFQVTPHTRAIVVVSPHNPLGTVWSAADWEALGAIARRHRLAVLIDEVFCETAATPVPRPAHGVLPLAITLNGFSKMLSLPGHKVAWARIEADAAHSDHAARLITAAERLLDALLPVAELQQAMVPGLLAAADPVLLDSFRDEWQRRHDAADEALLAGGRSPRPAAGIYRCIALRGAVDAEGVALEILHELGLHVHPGDYYRLPGQLVVTVAQRGEVLRRELARLMAWLDARGI
jgi:aspartate/methionine/tyrosine aminotransferase